MTISLSLDDKHYPADFPKYISLSATDSVLQKSLIELINEAIKGNTPYYVFAIATLRDNISLPCRFAFYDAFCYRNQAHPDFKKNLDPVTRAVIERIDYFAIPLLIPKSSVAISYPPQSYYSDKICPKKIERYAFDAANFNVDEEGRLAIQKNLYNFLFLMSEEKPELLKECDRWIKSITTKT